MISKKTLAGKKDYAISKISVFSVKGQAFFPSDNKKKEKYFDIVKKDYVKRAHVLKYRNRHQRLAI